MGGNLKRILKTGILSTVVFILLSSTVLQPAQLSAGESTPAASKPKNLGLAIALRKTEYKIHDPIELYFLIVNNEKKPVRIFPCLVPEHLGLLRFTISRNGVGPVSYVGPMYKILYAKKCDTIDPGRSLSETFDISKLYDLKIPGKYKVKCTYEVQKGILNEFNEMQGIKKCWLGKIESNVVEFKVEN